MPTLELTQRRPIVQQKMPSIFGGNTISAFGLGPVQKLIGARQSRCKILFRAKHCHSEAGGHSPGWEASIAARCNNATYCCCGIYCLFSVKLVQYETEFISANASHESSTAPADGTCAPHLARPCRQPMCPKESLICLKLSMSTRDDTNALVKVWSSLLSRYFLKQPTSVSDTGQRIKVRFTFEARQRLGHISQRVLSTGHHATNLATEHDRKARGFTLTGELIKSGADHRQRFQRRPNYDKRSCATYDSCDQDDR